MSAQKININHYLDNTPAIRGMVNDLPINLPDVYVKEDTLFVRDMYESSGDLIAGHRSFDLKGNVNLTEVSRKTPILLPKGLSIAGKLTTDERVTELPDGLSVGGTLVATNITQIPSGLKVGGDLIVDENQVRSIPSDTFVNRNILSSNGLVAQITGNKEKPISDWQSNNLDNYGRIEHTEIVDQNNYTQESLHKVDNDTFSAYAILNKLKTEVEKNSDTCKFSEEQITQTYNTILDVVKKRDPEVFTGTEIMAKVKNQLVESPTVPQFLEKQAEDYNNLKVQSEIKPSVSTELVQSAQDNVEEVRLTM